MQVIYIQIKKQQQNFRDSKIMSRRIYFESFHKIFVNLT